MEISPEFLGAKKLLQASQRIVILSHRNPDGDTVGSNLALRLALIHQWQKEVISACIDPIPPAYDFLPEVNTYQKDFDIAWPHLIVTVDVGASYMTRFHETKPKLFSGSPPVLNIDHHASNDCFGTINIVNDSAAAACQILYHFLKYCGFTIDRKIATCLLHGLYYDTGSFMHSNTTPEVLTMASDLLWKGADFKTIVKRQFHTMSVAQLRLYGKILQHARVNSKKITVSSIWEKDFKEAGANSEDTTGAIDYLNSIVDGKFSCLLYEDQKGAIKGSLRTRVEEINLSKLAGIFNGGGHVKAAGFSFPGRLLEINPRVRIEKA